MRHLIKNKNQKKTKNPTIEKLRIENIPLTTRNLNQISELINKSWLYDYRNRGFLTYPVSYISWALKSPYQNKELILGAYNKHNSLIGFNAVLPLKINFNNNVLLSGISTYLSVSPIYRKRGVAKKLLLETFEQMSKLGYDCCFAYFDTSLPHEAGRPVYKSIPNIELKKLYKSNWLVRILDVSEFLEKIGLDIPIKQILEMEDSGIKKSSSITKSKIKNILNNLIKKASSDYSRKLYAKPNLENHSFISSKADISKKLIAELLKIFNSNQNSTNLYHYWSQNELKWYLEGNSTRILIHRNQDNKINGIITYLLQTIKAKTNVKFAWIDFSYLKNLKSKEKKKLIAHTISTATSEGAIAIILPKTFKFNSTPFITNGFIPYPRSFDLHLILFSEKYKKMKFPIGKCYRFEVR